MRDDERSGLTTSRRGAELVERWNAGDRAYVLAQLADDFTLEARLPKLPVPMRSLKVRNKTAFRIGLSALKGFLPRFELVNAIENTRTIFLVLEDADRHILAVTIKVDDDGRFESIRSFRPNRLKGARKSGVWIVRATGSDGRTKAVACGSDEQVLDRVQEFVAEGFDQISVVDPRGNSRSLLASELGINK